MSKYTNIGVVGVVKVTRKAVLVTLEGEELWVPQSVIFEDDLAELEEGSICELNVQQWFFDREMR